MDMLPEGCVAKVLSLTSPKDACRLSLVGNTFRWAADSDAVWENFLPMDYKDIISRAASYVNPHPKSKKQVYFWLSDHPLIIDHGTKSFSLEKRSGKKCYMLAARDLAIIWGDTPRYWKWTSLPDSRFGEVAELMSVCWLEIRGKIKISLLSPNTTYTAFLVYKTAAEAFGFEYKPAEVSVGIKGGETKTKTVYLDPDRGRRLQRQIIPRQRSSLFNRGGVWNRRMHDRNVWAPRFMIEEEEEEGDEGVYPRVRGDGWMEIELGDYLNGDCEEEEEERELEMSLMEVKGGDWKSGLIVQGIEIRPKVADK